MENVRITGKDMAVALLSVVYISCVLNVFKLRKQDNT